jgi:hypothetical protein
MTDGEALGLDPSGDGVANGSRRYAGVLTRYAARCARQALTSCLVGGYSLLGQSADSSWLSHGVSGS